MRKHSPCACVTRARARTEVVAADADTSSEDGIAALCADTALLLLRRKQEWLYCCGEAKDHGRDEAALERFDRLAIREAAKFDDRDSSATVDAALAAAAASRRAAAAMRLLAAMRADGMLPDAVSYGSAIAACERARKWRAALVLLQEARAEGVADGAICQLPFDEVSGR